MVDSVGQTGNTPTVTNNENSAPVVQGETAEEVSSGYGSTDTVSYVEGETDTGSGQDSSVTLDTPDVVSINSRDYQQQAFDSRLAGFRAVVSEFNTRFNSSEIDLSDTHSLLILIKGIVSDTRALLQAQIIDQEASNNSLMQSKRQSGAQDQIRLKTGVAGIILEIALLAEESGDVGQQMSDLLAEKVSSQEELVKVQRFLSYTADYIPTVKQALGRVAERYDAETLETGEEELVNEKRENVETEVRLDREDLRHRILTQNDKIYFKDIIDDELDLVKRKESARTLLTDGFFEDSLEKNVLSQSQLQSFSALVPVPVNLRTVPNASEPPSSEQVAEVTEALALVLQANVSGVEQTTTSNEKEPFSQAHLGDNRSLEGADNPQAFGLILLEQNMAQLRDTIDNVQELESAESVEGVMEADSADEIMVAELMEQRQQVDAMVADALEEAELADAAIRRSPV